MQDAQEAAQRLEVVAALGVTLAIDDFGTGYSSLAYLKTCPSISSKVDQSFVRSRLTTEGDRAIVSAIVYLGRSLHLCVVAEGGNTGPARSAAADAVRPVPGLSVFARAARIGFCVCWPGGSGAAVTSP